MVTKFMPSDRFGVKDLKWRYILPFTDNEQACRKPLQNVFTGGIATSLLFYRA